MELGTVESTGALLPALVTYIPRKGQVDWLFLGTRAEARAFITRKVAEGYTRAWLWTGGATEPIVEQFKARMQAQGA